MPPAKKTRRARSGVVRDLPPQIPAVVLGVDGEGVSPGSFEVLPTLMFVQTWMSLAEAIAASDGKPLSFTGLTIREGSVAWVLTSLDPELSQSSFEKAHIYVVGDAEVPRGLRTKVVESRKSLGQLPRGYAPFIEIDAKRNDLPREFPSTNLYREVTTLRGEVVDAGGVRPHVRLASPSRMFFLSTSRENAKRAGQALYREIEANVALVWDGDQFVEGTLLDFEEIEMLSSDDEIARWRTWFSEAGQDWETVDDIELELGRERPGERDH